MKLLLRDTMVAHADDNAPLDEVEGRRAIIRLVAVHMTIHLGKTALPWIDELALNAQMERAAAKQTGVYRLDY